MSHSLKFVEKTYGRGVLLETINRRLSSKEKGLGYLASVDAEIKIKSLEAKKKAQKEKTKKIQTDI